MKRIYCLIGLLTLVPMGLLSCTSISTKVSTQNEPTSQVNTKSLGNPFEADRRA